MSEQIGTWARREQRYTWHLVESLVANDAVTRCGRRLRDEPNRRGALIFSDAPGAKCKVCDRGQ
jgi:hypothetical protein